MRRAPGYASRAPPWPASPARSLTWTGRPPGGTDASGAGLPLPKGWVVNRAAADDQVDHHADQRDQQHEQEPQGLFPAGHIRAAEDVDEHRDQDPEPDHPQEDLESS